jgi:very-short-patch-repair endonuclease
VTSATPTASLSRSAPPDQARWAAYCDYLLACVEAEAHESVSTLETGRGWTALAVNPLAEAGVRVPATAEIAAQARAGSVSLRLGWPVLAALQEDGTHRLVPLLVMDIDVSAEATPLLVPLDDRPSVNPGAGDAGLDQSDVAVVEEMLRSGAELSLTELVGQVVDALGLECEDLTADPHEPTATGAVQNVVLLEQLDGTNFTVNLQRELKALRERTDWTETAAAALLRDVGQVGTAPPAVVAAPVPLNDSQLDAVLASTAPVTVVTGPPGTGKSQVVTGVAATCWQAQQSFLVTSTNNAAVDVAVARLREVHPALVLRSGNQQAREALSETAADLLKTPPGPGPSDVALRGLQDAYDAVAALRLRSAARSQAQIRLLAAHVELEGATEGVLLDAHEQPDSNARDVVERIARLTRKPRLSWWRRRRLRRPATQAGVRMSADPVRIHAWAQAWLQATDATAELKVLGPLELADEVDAVVAAWQAASEEVLRLQAGYAVLAGRGTLQRLSDNRPRPGSRTLAEAADLQALRGWATTALSVAKTLPLQAGVVDVLILDEASQCSLAHVLPLAYRARRVVALGDPNQLKPVVTLTPEEESRAARSAGLEVGDLVTQRLSFRVDAAFDAFARSAGGVHLLDEHYRCHPSIAGWFNREFYRGTLTVLTTVDPEARRGIEAQPVHGTVERPSSGSWTNPDEAQRVCELAAELAVDGGTLGVVTPFAAQARLIRAALTEQQGEDWMTRHDVAVATAHRFQGGERDVVLFSAVVTPGMPIRSAQWVEQNRNLVNVGASRAKRLLVLVGHPDAAAAHDLPTLGSLWSSSATSIADDALVESELTEPERGFWRAFDDALGTITPRQRIEGYDVDFAWTAPWGMTVDIEIDDDRVDSPPRSRRRDIERDRVLNRVGWQVVRIPGWYCYAHPDAVIESLRDTLVVLQDPTSTTVELMPWVGR